MLNGYAIELEDGRRVWAGRIGAHEKFADPGESIGVQLKRIPPTTPGVVVESFVDPADGKMTTNLRMTLSTATALLQVVAEALANPLANEVYEKDIVEGGGAG